MGGMTVTGMQWPLRSGLGKRAWVALPPSSCPCECACLKQLIAPQACGKLTAVYLLTLASPDWQVRRLHSALTSPRLCSCSRGDMPAAGPKKRPHQPRRAQSELERVSCSLCRRCAQGGAGC
eukprot:934068-Rhodomonas_salina.3